MPGARTAKQKAAQRKAALASARKRRGHRSVRAGKKAYRKANYKGRGGYKRRVGDRFKSRGAYSTNRKGKKHGRAGRVKNVAVGVALHTGHVQLASLGVSHVRGRKIKSHVRPVKRKR